MTLGVWINEKRGMERMTEKKRGSKEGEGDHRGRAQTRRKEERENGDHLKVHLHR